MMAGMVLLLLLVAIIGGTALWVKQTRSQSHPAAAATEAGAAGEVGEAQPKRISLLTEAVGYVGTILVLAGAVAAVGQRWVDISTTGRLTILGAATLIFLGIGVFIRSSAEPAFQRLTSVTWVVSVAAFAGSAVVVNQSYGTSPETAFLTTAAMTTVYAAVLWLVHQHAIQQAVLFAGVVASTVAIILRTVDSPAAWMIAVPLWAIGVAWAAGGWWRRITPWFVAVPMGLLVALITPMPIESSAVRFGLGIGTAAAVMAFSVVAKFVPGLAMASVAMLGYVIGAVIYYFGDTLGVPASLTIAGLLILSLAAVATRWHWFSRKQPPVPPPAPSGSDTSSTPTEHHLAA
jgi:hypothetical protein